MIITRTPYPFVLLGAGTDDPEWSQKNGGIVLGFTIDKYVTVFAEQNYRGRSDCSSAYVGGFSCESNCIVSYHEDLPECNLAALQTGLTNTLTAIEGNSFYFGALAEKAYFYARPDMRVGRANYFLAALGGLQIVYFHHDSEEWSVYPQIELIRGLEERLLLLFLTGDLSTQPEEKAGKAKLLLVERGIRALQERNWKEFGAILDNDWSLQRADYRDARAEALYSKARIHGASGGRNFGSHLLLFCENPVSRNKVVKALEGETTQLPIKISRTGSRIIFFEGN